MEIVAVIGLSALVGGLVSATLSSQQRWYRATSESLDVRRSVRDAALILSEEIRGAAPRDTIRLMADSAIELFSGLGTSVACGSVGAADVALAPTNSLALGFTSWLAVPDTGDLALIYRSVSGAPGAWERYRIRGVSTRSAASVCTATSGLAGAGGSTFSYVLTLLPSPPPISSGSPVRFIRRGRYSLYKSSDGKWYLGYRRCNAVGVSVCGSIQPLSGYYRSYSSDTTRTGVLFRYLDVSGVQLTAGADPLRVTRIEIVARALSPTPVTIGGSPKAAGDSAVVSIALRNLP
ncbi:MAG: hypothetical protein M3Z17_02665 [Gemmatimonadota bacterium]|nr:hypothetical protein [Gemmatimonadota bacterium]